MWLFSMAVAYAEQCVPTPMPEQTLDSASVRALAVRSLSGSLTIVPAPEGSPIRLRGESCGELSLSIAQGSDAAEISARPRKGAARATLTLAVPPSVAALTVHGLSGALYASDLPLSLAVISSTGPVDVRGIDTLRVAYVEGSVVARDVRGDVSIDEVIGRVEAGSVGGRVEIGSVVGEIVSPELDAR